MSIFLREARRTDLDDLHLLAQQFVLLNLPSDRGELEKLLDLSCRSFRREIEIQEGEYLFVAEDSELNKVVGASKITAKHGTPEVPNLYYQIGKKEKFSKELGVGFIHQTLKFCEETDGPTEIGGLIVDKLYRRRPEKVGKSVSLVRFLYMGIFPELFQDELHCEFVPPLTAEGRSEFWEALGRRFTGMPYDEADRLSRKNKDFIRQLFPEDELYMTLLESSARLVVGEVGQETRPARKLLESIGFKYKDQVDPFDGGPHYGARKEEVLPIRRMIQGELACVNKLKAHSGACIVGGIVSGEFRAKVCFPELKSDEIRLNTESIANLDFEEGQSLYCIPLQYDTL